MLVSRDNIVTDQVVDIPVEERFIKIPIKNYTDLLGISPIPPQNALINAINMPEYRFIVAALSRRTGKSWISNIIGQLVVLVPGSQVLIIAPNYSLSQISWDLQRKFLNQFEIELERSNAKDKVIELKNGSIIRMGSVTQADSVVGRSYDLIIFDEAALNDKGAEVFNIQLRPTLDKPNSKAIFISTPRGHNWFHDFYQRGFSEDFPTWVSIKSTWKDNPRAVEEDIEDARKAMSKAEFEQEFECSFVALQGQIYDFSDDYVVDVDIENIAVLDVIGGLDVGFKDATAFCVVVIAEDGTHYVVDEYLMSGRTTQQHAEAIREKMDAWNIDFIYIDAAAAQTRYDFAMNYDIACINANKSVLDGIGFMAGLVDNGRLLVDTSCENTIECLKNYRWDDREGLLRERPLHNDYSHMADALRYSIYTYSPNLVGM